MVSFLKKQLFETHQKENHDNQNLVKKVHMKAKGRRNITTLNMIASMNSIVEIQGRKSRYFPGATLE